MQMATTLRNARCDLIESTIGTSPKLYLYSGAVPANCAASDPSGLLATLTLPSDWLAAASSGAKALAGTWAGTASGSGTCQSWRIKDSGATTCYMQGPASMSGGGGDIILDNTNIASGQAVSVTSFNITEANA